MSILSHFGLWTSNLKGESSSLARVVITLVSFLNCSGFYICIYKVRLDLHSLLISILITIS